MGDPQRELNSAVEHFRAGRFREAELAGRRVLRVVGDHPDVLTLTGLSALQCERTNEAVADLSRATQLNPKRAAHHSNLGEALRRAGRLAEAEASLRNCVSLDDRFADGWINLATLLVQQQRWTDAITAARRAAALAPQSGLAQLRLGQSLKAVGRVDESIDALRAAARALPTDADAHFELGDALDRLKRYEEAVDAFTAARSAAPGRAKTYYALGAALGRVGRLEDAIKAFREGSRIAPDDVSLASNVLFGLMYLEDISAEQLLAEHVAWAQRAADPITAKAAPHTNDPNPTRRLRVGYVSPDFRQHPLATIGLPLFSNHDPGAFDVYAYSDVAREDELTLRFRSRIPNWRMIVGRSDADVDEMIRADQIDVLVDLTMHMARGRPLLFARKPAPVQIAWFAYPGTTGMAAVDYRLTDPVLDPPGTEDGKYRETTVRLPDTFWCYDALSNQEVGHAPVTTNGFVTFGCLNGPHKLNDRTIELWARVVQAVEGSRFVLLAPPGRLRERVKAIFAAAGVEAQRLEFVEFRPRDEYLATYRCVDIALDTFPYNGHTTSLDAMWMGVPVVTMVGERIVSRAGLSQLTNIGLTELAANDKDAFVRIATDLASDQERILELRRTLRSRMEASPLMDGRRFARNLEAVYRACWQTWCAHRSSQATRSNA